MKVLVCTEYDDATSACSAQAWLESPTALPPLSVADATEIAGEIALLWAIAFTLRFIAQFIWRR